MVKTLAERFKARVVKQEDGCWMWQGVPTQRGYGQFMHRGVRRYVHRIAYELANGPLADTALIDHMCHVRMCVNPAHLRAVDQVANMQNRAGAQTNSRSGIRGVFRQGNRWRVQIRADGRNMSGGMFDSLEEAAEVASALRRIHQPDSLADRTPR